MRKTALTLAVSSALLGASLPSVAADLSGNLSLVSDYKFRGISQTFGEPAVQGGFDITNIGPGFYVGTWASNVSGDQFYSGNMELDVYGGWRGTVGKEVGVDLGLITYNYPGAKGQIPGVAPVTGVDDYDTTEIYAGLSYKWFSAKYSYALTDLFGINNAFASNIGICSVTGPGTCDPGKTIIGAATNRGSSKGSHYLDLGATFEVADKTNLGLHVGVGRVKNYGELNFTDYKLSLTKEWAGVTWGAALVGASTKDNYYVASDIDGWVSAGARGKTESLDKSMLVFSVAKTF
jgi:uncharacterized protein (TIGR02001 family)